MRYWVSGKVNTKRKIAEELPSYDEPEVAFRPILGPELASRVKVWDLNEEGEVSGLWRRIEIPNLWVMMGKPQENIHNKIGATYFVDSEQVT